MCDRLLQAEDDINKKISIKINISIASIYIYHKTNSNTIYYYILEEVGHKDAMDNEKCYKTQIVSEKPLWCKFYFKK